MALRTKRPRKKSMPPNGKGSEHWHQATFISIIRQFDHVAGRMTYACPNGFLRTKAMRIRAWQEGMLSGVWDVFVPIPAQGHPGLYIEFKVGDNDLTAEQRKFRAELEPLGFKFVVAYSWQEGLRAFCDYLDLEIQTSPI